jgi:hypothetical protein
MGGYERRPLSQDVLIADDDARIASALRQYLSGFTSRCFPAPVSVTGSPTEARRWLEKKAGILVLDSSVFFKMGIPVSELPARAIIWSDDHELLARARQQGLAALPKGSLEELMLLVREIGPLDGLDAA